MSGTNSLEDLKELLGPIHHLFSGIVWVLHDARDSEEAQYLESIKGEGKVIHYYYSGRHDASRNQYLWCGPIQQGEWIFSCDTLERVQPSFVQMAKRMLPDMENQNIAIALYYGKPLIYRHHESLEFSGTPHEGLRMRNGQGQTIELSRVWPDESQVRLNVRPLKRKDPYGWVGHYVRYYLAIPWGGNHCLLGNEHRGDPIALYREREQMRIEVRDYLRGLGVPLNEGGLRKLFSEPLSAKMIHYVNRERILNDAYRYWVLNDLSVKDDHTWKGMIHLDIPSQPVKIIP